MSAITRFQKYNFSKLRFQKFQRSYKSNQPSKQGAINASTIICRYFNKPRHIERECRRKHYDQRKKGKTFNAQAHSALIRNEEEDTSFIQAFMSKVQTNKIQMERLWYFEPEPPTISPIVENGYIITIHFIAHLKYASEIMVPSQLLEKVQFTYQLIINPKLLYLKCLPCPRIC